MFGEGVGGLNNSLLHLAMKEYQTVEFQFGFKIILSTSVLQLAIFE